MTIERLVLGVALGLALGFVAGAAYGYRLGGMDELEATFQTMHADVFG